MILDVDAIFEGLSTRLRQDLLKAFADEVERAGSSTAAASNSGTSLNAILHLARTLRTGQAVVFVTGAGLSYASGITPYRYSNKAIWSNFVMASGERRTFKEDPDQYWNSFWLRTHEIPSFINAKPNQGHIAIAKIMRKADAFVITQNIDTLHTKSGALENRLVEIHGRLGLYKCVNQATGNVKGLGRQRDCPYSRSISIKLHNLNAYAVDGTSLGNNNLRIKIPRCPGCLSPIMPHALMFDEQYVSHDFYRYYEAEQWLRAADAIVFVGTSFSVNITQDAINIALESSRDIELYSFNIAQDEKIEEASYQTACQRLFSQGSRPRVDSLELQWIIGPSEETLPLLDRILTELMSDIFSTEVHPDERLGQPRMIYCYRKEPNEKIGSSILNIN